MSGKFNYEKTMKQIERASNLVEPDRVITSYDIQDACNAYRRAKKLLGEWTPKRLRSTEDKDQYNVAENKLGDVSYNLKKGLGDRIQKDMKEAETAVSGVYHMTDRIESGREAEGKRSGYAALRSELEAFADPKLEDLADLKKGFERMKKGLSKAGFSGLSSDMDTYLQKIVKMKQSVKEDVYRCKKKLKSKRGD